MNFKSEPHLDTIPYVRGVIRALGVAVAAMACAVVFGVGIPLGWVWLAAQVQPTSGPNSGVGMLSVAFVILGPLASYIVLVTLAGRFRFSRPADDRPEPQRVAWTRSRDEIRQRAHSTTTFEQIVRLAILIVGL